MWTGENASWMLVDTNGSTDKAMGLVHYIDRICQCIRERNHTTVILSDGQNLGPLKIKISQIIRGDSNPREDSRPEENWFPQPFRR